ncbi:MAG: hypothetical protein A3F18_02300 [Legionellales bacterium RIFCSPHIGHO2_12_FULL_37_14]|nr:MAG: hypothetical protein A3F18_02300 [Legionellales bacterium RIFCSPHIGHO2_12_FULL_37_14]
MQTQLAKEVAALIAACPVVSIRQLISSHLNCKATSLQQVFVSNGEQALDTRAKNRVKKEYSLFTLILSYAPQELKISFLQLLFAEDVGVAIPIINKPVEIQNCFTNGLLIGLANIQPDAQNLILAWVDNLNEENFTALFTGSDHIGPFSKSSSEYLLSSWKILLVTAPLVRQSFCKGLEKLAVTKRYNLLATAIFGQVVLESAKLANGEQLISWIFTWLIDCDAKQLHYVFFNEQDLLGDALWSMVGGESITLWDILLSCSSPTIKQILAVFDLLAKDLLLLHLGQNPSTKKSPLVNLFNRLNGNTDVQTACELFIEFCTRHAILQPLLLADLSTNNSLLTIVVKKRNLVLLRIFLEHAVKVAAYQEYLPKLEERAITHREQDIACTISAYKYLSKIKLRNPQVLPINNKAVLNVQFANGSTLLHAALYQANQPLSEFLLQQGASSLIVANNNLTPFDLALEQKNFSFLQKIILKEPKVLCGKGLAKIYDLGDLDLFVDANKLIFKLDKQELVRSYIEVLAILTNESLQLSINYFAKSFSETEFVEDKFNPAFFRSAINMTQSLSLVFLLEIGKFLTHTVDHSLDAAFLRYLERSLSEAVAETEAPSIYFFFNSLLLTMKPKNLLAWLLRLEVNITQTLDKALKAALFQAVIKPQIFYTLTLEEQTQLISYFGQESDYVHTFINFHFKETGLFNLSFPRLRHLALVLPLEENVLIWQQTQDVLLYMLIITQAVNLESELFYLLYNSFASILHNFCRLNPQQQFYCLNLVSADKVVELWVNAQDGLLNSAYTQYVSKLYATFCNNEFFALIHENSAVEALFRDLSSNWPDKCEASALKIWFQRAATNDTARALDTYLELLEEDTSLNWFKEKANAILDGILTRQANELLFYKWLKVNVKYALKCGYNALENIPLNHFPRLEADIGKAALAYCQIAFEDCFIEENIRQTLLKTMLYFAEWVDEDEASLAPYKRSRLIGIAVLLKHYPAVLDASFVMRWFNTYFAALGTYNSTCQEFLHTLISFIQHDPKTQGEYILCNLNNNQHKLLVERILDTCNSQNYAIKEDGKYLLQWLLDFTPQQKAAAQQVMYSLGAQDLNILQTPHLTKIATEILQSETSTVATAVYDGVWIQRLILAPRFVAAITPSTLARLLTRYQAVSFLLKQEEHAKLNAHLKYLQFNSAYMGQLKAAQINHLRAKAKRLLTFRAEDSIRALLIELEDAAKTWPDEIEKKAALHVLYKYYHLRVKETRTDLLFRCCKQQVQRIFNNVGDLKLAQNVILTWLKKYLPQCYFYHEEAVAKHSTELRNQQQEVVGYVNDSSYAMGLDAVKIIKDLPAGSLFYDKVGRVIGHLTEEGLFKPNSIFQLDTAALMLRSVPLVDLKNNLKSADIVLIELIESSNFALLYKSEIGDLCQEKQNLLEERIVNLLLASNKTYSQQFWQGLASCMQSTWLINLISAKRLTPENAILLLDACIKNNEEVRRTLLTHHQDKLINLLARVDKEDQYLLQFLRSYYQEPWFIDVLTILLKKDGFLKLHKSFSCLKKAVNDSTLKLEVWQQIGQKFIDSEKGADLFLSLISAKKAKQEEEDLAVFFEKFMLLPTLEKLANTEKFSSRLKALEHIFNKAYRNLFHYEELRLAKRFAWFKDELKIIKNFIGRFKLNNIPLGQALCAEITLRSANFGLCDIFYPNGRLDEDLLHIDLPHSAMRIMHGDDESESQHANYLQIKNMDERAVIDWRTIANKSWDSLASQNKINVFAFFLFNYQGDTEKLKRMVQDYIRYSIQGVGQIDRLAKFTCNFPEISTSSVIAEELLTAVIKYPYILNHNILQGLANTHLYNIVTPMGWLQYFGQQKHYKVLARCCSVIIEANLTPKSMHPLITKIAHAANLEESLLGHVNRWYFGVYAFCKRVWYGILQEQHLLLQYLKPAQHKVVISKMPDLPKSVGESKNKGQFVDQALNIHHHQKQLRALKDRVGKIGNVAPSSVGMFSKRASDATNQNIINARQNIK